MYGTQHTSPEWLQDYPEERIDPEVLRWRNVILRLNERIVEDARQYREWAPYLSEAFSHAVFRLLMGDKNDLVALSDWLDEEVALDEMRSRRHDDHLLTLYNRSPSLAVAALAA